MPPGKPLAIYCADVGSVARRRFGWARGLVDSGSVSSVRASVEIRELAAAVCYDLNDGLPVALGFECPLFIPIREEPELLTAARTGEGNRPWSAGAGTGALAVGLSESVWILREVRRSLRVDVSALLDWDDFSRSSDGLFLWEAFVTSHAKGASHVEDAELAVRQFALSLPDVASANAVREDSVHSLIGAALLRTGWSRDPAVLEAPVVVIKV